MSLKSETGFGGLGIFPWFDVDFHSRSRLPFFSPFPP